MVIKVYHSHGKVKITKTMNQRELVMFSDLDDGEIAEIEIGVSQHTEAKKKKMPEQHTEAKKKKMPEGRPAIHYENMAAMINNPDIKNFEHAIEVLKSALDNGCLEVIEASRAIAVLTGRWDDRSKVPSDLKAMGTDELFGRAIGILRFAANTDASFTSEKMQSAIDKLMNAV